MEDYSEASPASIYALTHKAERLIHDVRGIPVVRDGILPQLLEGLFVGSLPIRTADTEFFHALRLMRRSP